MHTYKEVAHIEGNPEREKTAMSGHREQKSEVARLLAQINNEYESACRGLSGLSQGSSQHEFITKRMERMAELHFQLRNLVGDEAMKQIACELEQA